MPPVTGRFEEVEGVGQAAGDGCFEVSHGSLDGAGRCRGLFRHVGHAEVHQCLVKFVGGDFALGHGIPEIAGEGPVLEQRLLEFAGRARDGVGQLVPVLRRKLARSGRLGEHHSHGAEGVCVAAGHGVQVAGGLCKAGVVLDAVRGELRRSVLDGGQVIHCAVRVVARRLACLFDVGGVDAGEAHGVHELVGAVRHVHHVAGEALDRVPQRGHALDGQSADGAAESGRLRGGLLERLDGIIGVAGDAHAHDRAVRHGSLLRCFFRFLEQFGQSGAPIQFVGLVPPLPWRAAETACQEERETAERVLWPRG